MNNLNPLYETLGHAVGHAVLGTALSAPLTITAGSMTYHTILNIKRKRYCKQLLNDMDLESLWHEAYDCCEYIYASRGENREILYTMCYPKLVEALKEKDIDKLKSSICKCVTYEVKTPFLKQIYKKFPYNSKTETISGIAGGAIGSGLIGYGMYKASS